MKDLGLSGIIPVPAGCLPAWQRPAPGSSAVIVSIFGDSRVIFTIRNTFYKVSVDDSPPLVLGERPAGRGQALAGTKRVDCLRSVAGGDDGRPSTDGART
jgi:hypothetical protein